MSDGIRFADFRFAPIPMLLKIISIGVCVIAQHVRFMLFLAFLIITSVSQIRFSKQIFFQKLPGKLISYG